MLALPEALTDAEPDAVIELVRVIDCERVGTWPPFAFPEAPTRLEQLRSRVEPAVAARKPQEVIPWAV